MEESEKRETKIDELGKFGLIGHLTKNIKIVNASSFKGIGDDSAIVDPGGKMILVSTDLLLEGIHFNLIYTPLKHLGYKAVIRAIADIYSMNGKPEQILIALGISSRFSVEDIEEIYDGIKLACDKYKIDLVGGDTTSSLTGLTIGVTALGSVEKENIITRGGAKPNDLICVTGDLGASYMGLQLLERERKLFEKGSTTQPDLSGYEYIVGRQLKPEFPVKTLEDLHESGVRATSMIDVSDCLASDLLHICKLSETGCRIYSNKIPIDFETARLAEEFNIDPVIPALNGGEDYELLFTVPLDFFEEIGKIHNVKVVGHIMTPDSGKYLVGEGGSEIEIHAQGWNKQ